MKKRRVLALLLALSLAVSTNGMTVFATEAGEPEASAVSIIEESTDDVQDETEQTDAVDDDADDEQDIDSDDTEKNDEAGGGVSDASGEEDSDEQNPAVEDAGDETVSGNDLPDEEEPAAEEAEELLGVMKNEVRMVTFTDDTGLKITYDANAAANYEYTVENGVLTGVIDKGTGKAAVFTGNVELTQPEEAEKQYTSIATSLFSGNKDVTYVKLPNGVTSIGDDTFNGCTALKGAYVPATVTLIGASAFEGCIAMTQIAVPKAVTAIGNGAFKNDAKLYMVYMKDVDYSALTTIGDRAFEGCTALAEFCSDTEFYIPASLKSIGESAFKNCKKIKKLDLDTAQLTTMGASAFEGCTGMTDAVICRTLAEIPTNAFKGCTGLASLMFSSQVSMTIGERAFYGCYSLRQVVLPETVGKVSDYAFEACSNLSRVVVESALTEIGLEPFPTSERKSTLYLVGKRYISSANKVNSKIYDYYRKLDESQQKMVTFIETDVNNGEFYKYRVVDIDEVEHSDGKIPGGQIWVGTAEENHSDKNINTLHEGKGVISDTTKYYVYYKAENGYSLVDGSIRSNGEIVQKDKKGYYITMPLGGTVITAEFRRNDLSDKIEGQQNDVTVEFSNGEPIPPDGVDYGVELKVGQTTRMFLIDGSGVPISSSQIKKIASSSTTVAKVSNTGLITAVGKGTAKIKVDLTGGDGNPFSIKRTIRVVEADIASISLVASNYDPIIEITGDIHGIQTAAVAKNIVSGGGLSITLKANAYTEAKEGVAKELTWKSSDTSVATVKQALTTSVDPVNVVEIKKGSEGEATITVTAKVNSKKTVTQKFVVSVQNQTVKLASSSVTVNPNLKECGELEIISSYGASLSAEYKIYKKEGNSYFEEDFTLERKGQQSGNNKSCRYSISLRNQDIRDGKYKVFVCKKDGAKDESMPLTITVKRSVPAPAVKFNTQKTKFNLFYKNGGTDADGNQITVTTEVTKLGKVKLSDAELCALTDDKEDDQLFLDNFEIVKSKEDLAKGIITIRRKAGNLKYTQAKKPAVTGYLKLSYEGYNSDVAKKVKVTMPTVTTAPAYVLDRTSETYRDTALEQQETLKLLDKKTKQQIILDNTKILLNCEADQMVNATLNQDSEIIFSVYPVKDKLKFILKNPTEWDKDKDGHVRELSYTFNVKVTSAEPTITTDQTVTLNLNYPEVEGTFGLKSNQRDTVLDGEQTFTAKSTANNKVEYDKLDVSYENGKGTVKILGEKPKAGTYKWTCTPKEMQGSVSMSLRKAATLTVKVVDAKPIVKLGKGSLVLNLATRTVRDNVIAYDEIAEIPLKITGKPEGYTLDTSVNTGNDSTKIECTNRNTPGAAENFDWTLQDATVDEDGKLVDGKLSVSVKDSKPPTTGNYSFKLTAKYVSMENGNVVDAKPMTFKVKVDSNTAISVSFSAKGKLNLVDREGEYTAKNSIVYTPTLKNVRGTITDAWIYDVDTNEESKRFDIYLNPADGKLYVTPKKTQVNIGPGDNTGNDSGDQPSAQSDAVQGYEYAALENNTQYRVKIEVKVDGYNDVRGPHKGILSTIINIKTAQVLPKVTTDKSTIDVYLSNKQYDATFTVTPQEGAAGIVEEIKFHDDDEVPRDAFDISYITQPDGSLKVTVHLKEAVAYKCDSTNKVKMYIKFKGQGTNTTGTLVNMNIRVNK